MQKFDRLVGPAAPLMQENINTDAIMPTPWIIEVNADWANGLFRRWRYDLSGQEIADFPLNQSRFRNATILVAGSNFGCGSSREEAVWGLDEFGIRCVIAPSFGDIFFENAFKNGLLPIVLPAAEVAAIADALAVAALPELVVDLGRCTVVPPGGVEIAFSIDPGRRAALLDGMDEIDQTLARSGEIDDFQAADRRRRPWIHRLRAGKEAMP